MQIFFVQASCFSAVMSHMMENPALDRIKTRMGDIIQRIDNISQKYDPRPENIQPAVQESTPDFMQSSGAAPISFGRELDALIQKQSEKHNISADLVRAVVQTESGGHANAVSPAGAVGLMQLMPDTARDLGVDPYNPEENLDGGIRFLKQMGKSFGSLENALAAYNAGPGAVRRFGGVPPYRETQNYVRRIEKLLIDRHG